MYPLSFNHTYMISKVNIGFIQKRPNTHLRHVVHSLADLHMLPTAWWAWKAGMHTDEIKQVLAALVKTNANRWHGNEAQSRHLLLQACIIIMFLPSSATRPQISEMTNKQGTSLINPVNACKIQPTGSFPLNACQIQESFVLDHAKLSNDCKVSTWSDKNLLRKMKVAPLVFICPKPLWPWHYILVTLTGMTV